MSTLPGVSATTQVVNRNPRGNSDALVCLIGAAQQASAIGGVAQPFLFTTYNQAASALGVDTSNGRLIDMIYAAFNNGAKQVLGVVASITGAANLTEFSNALAAIDHYDGINGIAVESTDLDVAQALETHCDTAATAARWRRGYVGLPTGSVVAGFVTRAQAIDSERMFVVGPNLKDTLGNEVPGGITASVGAIVAEKETDPALPITKSQIKGYDGLFLDPVDSDYDTLHNGGVFTLSERGADGVMRYLTSKTTGSEIIREGTISKVRDYVMARLKAILESEFSRSKLTNSVLKQIESRVLTQMNIWSAQEIINPDNQATVTAESDLNDPTKVNVSITYNALYPVNFITLNITLIL